MTAKRKTLKMKQFKCFCTTYACTIPRASAIRFRMPYGRMQRGTASPSRPYKITCYIILENPLLLASTNASIYREMYIIKHPRLDRKDDCYLCPVVVMSIVSDTQYLHSPPPCGCISPVIPQTCQSQVASIGAPLIHQEEEDNSKIPRHETQRPAAVSGILRWTPFSA